MPIKENGIGFACIAEARTAEKAKFGAARTPFLKAGDRLRIAAIGKDGQSVFGDMDNTIQTLG